jgi:heme exporter protein A
VSPCLVAEGLTVTRGERPLFEGLGFALARGAVLLLRGPNGSGKSTLLRALLGLATIDAGTVRFDGESFDPGSGRLRPRALYLGHAGGMKAELPARQALAFAAELDRSPHDPQALAAALARLGLARRATLACRQLSQGQRQRLALGRLVLAAAATDARPLWLLDEPQAALDADGAALFDDLLAEHRRRGGSAIVATHGPVPAAGADATTVDLGQVAASVRDRRPPPVADVDRARSSR